MHKASLKKASSDKPAAVKKTLTKIPRKASRRSLTTLPQKFPEVNARLRQIREEKGLTQDDLAKLFSIPNVIMVTSSQIKAIEYNVVAPSIFMLRCYKRISKRSWDWILAEPGKETD